MMSTRMCFKALIFLDSLYISYSITSLIQPLNYPPQLSPPTIPLLVRGATSRNKLEVRAAGARAAVKDALRSTLIFDILYKSLKLNDESNFKRKLNYE